jgi:hypothetical protein
VVGGRWTEDREQKTEDGGQKAEVGGLPRLESFPVIF